MLKRTIGVLSLISSLSFLAPPGRAAETVEAGFGAFAQVVSGGPWVTVMTLVNMNDNGAPWELHFVGNDGQPMTVATSAGTGSMLSGTLNLGGSIIIQTTGDPNAPVQEGWAYLVTTATSRIGGSAVFRLTRPGSPTYEAALPLDTSSHFRFAMSIDELNASTGLALANSIAIAPITVTLTFYDLNGVEFFTDTLPMATDAHTSFMLRDRYPQQLAGKQGLMVITGSNFLTVLGLRANAGGFTSMTPLVIPGW